MSNPQPVGLHDCKPTGCGFDPHSRRCNIYLNLYFYFLRSGVQAKRSVEFCHLIRNVSGIRQKVGNGVSFTTFPLPTLLCAGYSVKLKKKNQLGRAKNNMYCVTASVGDRDVLMFSTEIIIKREAVAV